MRTRTSPIVLGFIWGMFSMLLSFAVVSVFASLQVVFTGFPMFAYNGETQYIIIGAIFLLSVLGAIGSGLVPRLPKLGGAFILLSCCGVALLMFAPVLMQSFSFTPLEAFGIKITPLALLITDFALIVFTVIGLAGGILAFIPKKARNASQPLKPELPFIPFEAAPTPISAPVQAQPAPPPAPMPVSAPIQAQPVPAPAPMPIIATVPPAAPTDIIHAGPPISDIDLMDLE